MVTAGLGGAFLLATGKVKQHVMQDFSKIPINTEEELNNWLRFYNMSAPLVALGTFVSSDPVSIINLNQNLLIYFIFIP